jgi:hypothetical protein
LIYQNKWRGLYFDIRFPVIYWRTEQNVWCTWNTIWLIVENKCTLCLMVHILHIYVLAIIMQLYTCRYFNLFAPAWLFILTYTCTCRHFAWNLLTYWIVYGLFVCLRFTPILTTYDHILIVWSLFQLLVLLVGYLRNSGKLLPKMKAGWPTTEIQNYRQKQYM